VIGNPPYKQIPKGLYSEQTFPFSEGKDKGKQNLYKLFVEASYNFTKQNRIACMIVQSSLLCDLSSQYTRELILTKTTIDKILEFPKLAPTKEGQVFESVLQGTAIYLFVKKANEPNNEFLLSVNNDVITLKNLEFEKLNSVDLIKIYPNGYFIPLVKTGEYELIKKLNKKSFLFSNIITEISQGDLNLTSEKLYFGKKITSVILYRGKNTHRYFIDNNFEEYVNNTYKKEIVAQNCEKQYIVCQQVTGTIDKYRLHFALTLKNTKFLFGNSVNKLKIKDNISELLILGILNSKLLDWYFRKTSTNNHVNGYEIEQFPISKNIEKPQQPFIKLVETIIEKKKAGQDSSKEEAEIDAMVYKLYELTDDEIKVVEGK